MARNLARIPLVDPDDPRPLIDKINTSISEINRALTETETEINHQKGNDGATVIFNNVVNMTENRITNVERSRDPADVVTRQELVEIGILGSPTGQVVFNRDVIFAAGTSVTGPSGGTGIATGAFVEHAIDSALEAEVPSSNEGNVLTTEGADGADGITAGTPIFGRDPDGKARFFTLTRAGLKVDTSTLEQLLLMLIEEIRELKNGN